MKTLLILLALLALLALAWWLFDMAYPNLSDDDVDSSS